MTEFSSYADIEEKFRATTDRVVWCTVATVDRRDRPRSRILHPIWDGPTGWILTNRHSHKEKHLAHNAYVSCSYWDPQHDQAIADCRAEWVDDADTKTWLWELFKSAPEPLGYDPVIIWPDKDDPSVGVLKLTPWRVAVWSMAEMAQGKPAQVWRQQLD